MCRLLRLGSFSLTLTRVSSSFLTKPTTILLESADKVSMNPNYINRHQYWSLQISWDTYAKTSSCSCNNVWRHRTIAWLSDEDVWCGLRDLVLLSLYFAVLFRCSFRSDLALVYIILNIITDDNPYNKCLTNLDRNKRVSTHYSATLQPYWNGAPPQSDVT